MPSRARTIAQRTGAGLGLAGRGLLVVAAVLLLAATPARAADFAAFVAGLWPQAEKAGVSRATFDAAFAGVTPDPKVISLAGAQPEFSQTIRSYVQSRVTDARVAQGRDLARRWKPWLDRIERETGVDRAVILAIWGLESNYGSGAGNSDTIRSLATLACCTTRRPDYFRGELIAALQILEAHDIPPRAMTGSWAGALGQTQFMPSSFLKHAVDMDGDGRRDIWRSVPDVLGSIATYLDHYDWKTKQRWGYEVRLPADFDFTAITPHEGQPPAAWAKLGLTRADGQALPADGKAWLLLPAGARGPAFLTLENYWAIKSYNISDSYTLSVGLLADRIRGGGPVAGTWPADDKALTRVQLEAMQRRLVALGFSVDTIDGKVGPGTRAAVRAWQASVGLTADGYATSALLQRMGAVP